jgi:hypothetical protein
MAEPLDCAPEGAETAAGTPPQDGADGCVPAASAELMGRRVTKVFGKKRYLGTVTAFCAEELWFTVTYEDGCVRRARCVPHRQAHWAPRVDKPWRLRRDSEELDASELIPLLVPEGAAEPAREAAPADEGGAGEEGSGSECAHPRAAHARPQRRYRAASHALARANPRRSDSAGKRKRARTTPKRRSAKRRAPSPASPSFSGEESEDDVAPVPRCVLRLAWA